MEPAPVSRTRSALASTAPVRRRKKREIAISLFPYGPELSSEALRKGDLQFAANAVITILDRSHPDWWTGALGDCQGPFPACFVASESLGTAVVTHAYVPQRDDELALAVGDRVHVYERRANGWWRVIHQHKRGGLFPASRLSMQSATDRGIDSPRTRPKKKKGARSKRDRSSVALEKGLDVEATRNQLTRSAPSVRSPRACQSVQLKSPREKAQATAAPLPSLAKARVVRAYQANHPGDLSLTEGSLVFLTKSRGPWWEGVDKTGARGIFPAKCVEKMPEETSC